MERYLWSWNYFHGILSIIRVREEQNYKTLIRIVRKQREIKAANQEPLNCQTPPHFQKIVNNT